MEDNTRNNASQRSEESYPVSTLVNIMFVTTGLNDFNIYQFLTLRPVMLAGVVGQSLLQQVVAPHIPPQRHRIVAVN